jgi:hypothetical protein
MFDRVCALLTSAGVAGVGTTVFVILHHKFRMQREATIEHVFEWSLDETPSAAASTRQVLEQLLHDQEWHRMNPVGMIRDKLPKRPKKTLSTGPKDPPVAAARCA